jgi:chromosome partitioning protein
MTAKGGTGKTTLVIGVAVAAMEAGERVFLVDLDAQRSLTSWGERRQAEEPAVDRISPDQLAPALAGLAASGYTLAVIDTAGVDNAATSGDAAADLSLIPARPSALYLQAARPTMAALARMDRPFAFVLIACQAGRRARLEDAGRALSMLGDRDSPCRRGCGGPQHP